MPIDWRIWAKAYGTHKTLFVKCVGLELILFYIKMDVCHPLKLLKLLILLSFYQCTANLNK